MKGEVGMAVQKKQTNETRLSVGNQYIIMMLLCIPIFLSVIDF